MTDLPAALPPAMVEAAARALHEHENQWLDESMAEEWKTLSDLDLDSYRSAARAVLAAALAECEVREEWIAEVDLGHGFEPRPWVYTSEAGVDAYMRAIVKPKRKLCRLVITTKPEPVASPVDTPREDTR